MRFGFKTVLGAAGLTAGLIFATQAAAQVTFYEHEGFAGRFLTADGAIADLNQYGFGDRAASATVSSGRWEACTQPGFQGRCVVLQSGSYPSLAGMDMNSRISSVRPAGDARVGYLAPAPVAVTTYARPADEVYQVPVISAQAVVGAPEQRCWMERKQIGPLEFPGAVITGVGDMLSGQHSEMPLVQHCDTLPGTTQYWDVRYEFRGVQHRVQLSSPPGPTIAVNGYGQPRG